MIYSLTICAMNADGFTLPLGSKSSSLLLLSPVKGASKRSEQNDSSLALPVHNSAGSASATWSFSGAASPPPQQLYSQYAPQVESENAAGEEEPAYVALSSDQHIRPYWRAHFQS